MGLGVVLDAQRRVLGGQPGQALRQLVLVGLRVRLDRERQQRLGHAPRPEHQRRVLVREGVSGLRAAEAADRADVAGDGEVDRTVVLAERGFRPAPVIIGTEFEEEVGGGTSQVATTVFNAAWEAGLDITERNPHSLYISRYQLGRDATVNYPDLDLVFRNDTDRWLLVRTFVGTGSLTVNIYGTPTGRRVETETAPLVTEGKVPWKRIDDSSMYKGEKVVEQYGVPPQSTSVRRRVFAPDGKLMYDTTWHSYYVGEPTVVRLGSKVRPKVTPPPAAGTATQSTDTAKQPANGAKKDAAGPESPATASASTPRP